jgi:hypothetical protein
MNAKVLLALALAAAIGGPAWSEDYSRNLGFYPDPQGSPTDDADDEGGDASFFGPDGGLTARGGENPNEILFAPGPNAPNPHAPSASPYANPAAANPHGGGATDAYGPVDGTAAAGGQNPYEIQSAPGPSAPSVNPYAEPAAANPYRADSDATGRQNSALDQGLGARLYDPLGARQQASAHGESYDGASTPNPYAANPYGAGKPRTEELNGDPLGTLGFDPYDAKSLLAPKGKPANPAASGLGSGALGSTVSSSALTPTTSYQGAAQPGGGGASDPFGSANSSLSSGGFPPLGPTTPGGPAQ